MTFFLFSSIQFNYSVLSMGTSFTMCVFSALRVCKFVFCWEILNAQERSTIVYPQGISSFWMQRFKIPLNDIEMSFRPLCYRENKYINNGLFKYQGNVLHIYQFDCIRQTKKINALRLTNAERKNKNKQRNESEFTFHNNSHGAALVKLHSG